MGDAADAGDPLRQHHPARGVEPFEALLHAAVLVEEMWLVVQDLFTDIEEGELGGFQHIGPDRPERQGLHIGCHYLRQEFGAVGGGQGRWLRNPGPNRRKWRRDILVQNESVRLRMPAEPDPIQIHDLALVPAQQRPDLGKARRIAGDFASPQNERPRLGRGDEITQFQMTAICNHGVCHSHARAGLKQMPCRRW